MKSSGEHRRGHSMGSAPPAVIRSGEKDEDLALFHEMKRREKHNFLHPSPDDLDATLSSKFGGMGAPVKKPGTDLLTSESDKNDYDWLLTPPGTPLFPSLDQEAAALAVLSPALSNGSHSSASSATKSLKYSPAESVKGSRGNPSPRRQMSTGSSTPNGISRSKSSPGPAPILTRPSTPTSAGGTRPSTPTSKSTAPSLRSSTPSLKLTISHSAKSFSNATTPTGTRPSTPTPRSSTPTARPSTPGGRSSTPTSKPSTPTMRRSLSGGRTGITSPSPTTTRGGPSPKRSTSASRGNSPSAKRITAVITSIAGMSSEVPPNLRTTMSERSTSNGQGGLSNGSNHSNVEDSAQSRRRPSSPSVTRSFSSSSSQEQRTSSQTSRGSVVSSYDDGLEVNRPSSYGSGRNSAVGKWHATAHEEFMSGRTSAYTKRVAKSSSSRETSGYGVASSKKSSDHLKRPVDAYQNSPASAYRHLHSSSPGAPFYSTRTVSSLLMAGVAMNSSMTTSSNASSEHGTTVAADTEGSERDEDDLLSWDSYGKRASMSPRLQQADILVLDKDEEKTAPWQDSPFERANSHGPPSSHSQGSQSTLDAEVTGFYETDGIASLEMLEHLGLMGENCQLKTSSPSKLRSSEKRTSSTEDIRITNLNHYGLSRISPSKIYQVHGSPAQQLADNLEKQGTPERPRSRDFDSKIPAHLVFQENLPSPARHSTIPEKQQELPERPRKSRDVESRTSPSRKLSLEGGQGSPSQRLSQLEKQDSLERQRKSRDVESRTSPSRKLSLEGGQGSPSPQRLSQLEKQDSLERRRRSRDFESKTSPHRRISLEGQGSPSRRLAQFEKQDRVERRDFEAELMRRSGDKSLGVVEPQVPSSEIRAACLFVRDFKVGLSSPQNQDLSAQAQDNSPRARRRGIEEMDNSPGDKKLGIKEMEMKLANELSYDWDNSIEVVEQPRKGPNGDIKRGSSDSPILVSRPENNVGVPKSSVRVSLDFLVKPLDIGYQTEINDSLATSGYSKHGGTIDARLPELTLLKDVEVDHLISRNGTPTSAEKDDSSVQDGAMDESESESSQSRDVDMDSPIPPEKSRPNARVSNSEIDLQRAAIRDTLQFTSKLLGIQSYSSDDGVDAMDEDLTGMRFPDDGTTASVREDELGVLEESSKEGHVGLTEKQCISHMDVEEVSTALPESHTGDALGGIHDKVLHAGIKLEAAGTEEEVNVLQSSKGDAANEGLPKIRCLGTGNAEGVMVEEDGMWYSEAGNQQDVVESFLQAVPFSLETGGSEEACHGEDGLEAISAESDGVDVPSRQVEQAVHSNGNHLLPSSQCANDPEIEPISHHDVECVLTNVTNDHSPPKLPGYASKSPVDVKQISPRTPYFEINQEAVLDESFNATSVYHCENDPTDVLSDGTPDPIIERVVDTEASQGVFNGVFDRSTRLGHEDSQEYVDIELVAPMDDIGNEAGYNASNHLAQEELQIPSSAKSEFAKQVHHFPSSNEDVDFLRNDTSRVEFSPDEACKEDINFFHKKLTEYDARCVENQERSYASATADFCEPKSVPFDGKNLEVLDVSSSTSEDISQVQPPKHEFRSASTLCAALEEQIAGLIQKIDSAIEESTKPFNGSPQESLLLRDKRSTLETHQDECTGSVRSSQEEDLIDMLWAEDGETSGSEESRDQDFLNSNDCSQRDMNGVVRSFRLSGRGLPISGLLGQSNDGYDAVVRASRSDLGVEKRVLEGLSKRNAVLLGQQPDDAVHMQSRESIKSQVKSPFLWSREMTDSLPEAHFRLEAESNIDESSGEGGQATADGGELQTLASGREHGSDFLLESSTNHDVEEMKIDAQLLSQCRGDEQSCGNLHFMTNSSPVLVSQRAEVGPVVDELVLPEGILVADATSLEKSYREAGEIGDAERALPFDDMALESASRKVDMSNIMSNGTNLPHNARDQAIQEQAHNRDRDESPILLTLARSELTSKVVNEVPVVEWPHRNSVLPEEALSTPHRSMGEEPAVDFTEEPQSVQEPEVEMLEASPSGTLTWELLKPKLEEETRVDIGNVLSHVNIGCVHLSEEVEHPLRLPSQNEVSLAHPSLDAGAVAELESPSGTESEERRNVGWHSLTNGIIESNQLPERNSAIHGLKRLDTSADAESKGQDVFAGQESEQTIPGGYLFSPNKSQISPRGGNGRSRRHDESASEVAAADVHEIWMSQGHPDGHPISSLNGSGEDVQVYKVNSNHSHRVQGQHISLNSGKKFSRPKMESIRLDETDSGAEIGRQDSSLSAGTGAADMVGREDVSSEAHVIDVVKTRECRTPLKDKGFSDNYQEITRLSVIRSPRHLPALNLTSPVLRASSKEERQGHHEDLGIVSANGELGTGDDQDKRKGDHAGKRLPINKAKSVRTISLSPTCWTRSPPKEPSSPEGEVYTPQKCDAYANITVISPDSLQWDPSSPAAETPTKTRSSPSSVSRNMTLAEATDTILFCSSLMHTIVYKAAAYAIEKEELAVLASTPNSNGEVQQLSGSSAELKQNENDTQVGETESSKLQGSNNGPPSVRRALSYTAHQTVPSTPADTSLQIPVSQVIENVNAPEGTAEPSPDSQRNEIVPVKVSKGKCGCSIM